MPLSIKVAARASPLSQAQVGEVLRELQADVSFDPIWVETSGDKDLKTSLRHLGKSNFFTEELDQMLLMGKCRAAIHSAKDLPEKIPEGLAIAAITQGIDPSDSLVYNQLPIGARIGTSCERRDLMVKKWRGDLQCVDVRGTIQRRLELVDNGELNGVVVAEAALIRLNIDRPRIKLEGDTTPLQGKLAVLIRQDDQDMAELFASIDARPTKLYLGTDPTPTFDKIIHYPVIKIVPRQRVELPSYTHVIFTSKNAVDIFCDRYKIADKQIIAIGKITAERLLRRGLKPDLIAEEETQEGIIAALCLEDLTDATFLLPRSSLSRPVLTKFLEKCHVIDLYDTVMNRPDIHIDWQTIDEIIFTSPSTVEAFFTLHPTLPKSIPMTPIGPITKHALLKRIS